MSNTISLGGITDKPTTINKTGSWRTFRPTITERCTGCRICEEACPDACIEMATRKDNTKFKLIAKVDYDYCKGCLICKNECPFKAIDSETEK